MNHLKARFNDILRYSCRLAYPDNDEYKLYLKEGQERIDQLCLKTWHNNFMGSEAATEKKNHTELVKYLTDYEDKCGVDLFHPHGIRSFFLPKLMNKVTGLGERKDFAAEKAYERLLDEQCAIGTGSNDPFLDKSYEALVSS